MKTFFFKKDIIFLFLFIQIILFYFNLFIKFYFILFYFNLLIIILLIIKLNSINFKLKNKRFINFYFILFPILILIISRLILISNSSFSLGYDSGLYKYLFEESFFKLQEGNFSNISWITLMYLPGASILSSILLNLGYTSTFLITYFLIFLDLLLLFNIYIISKHYFSRDVAILSSFLYSISIVAFQVFWYDYYKNIIGIILILQLFYLLEKQKYFLSSIVGGFLGGLHRPSFVIFSITYFFNWFEKKRKELFIVGIIIILLSLSFYINNFYELFVKIFIKITKSLTTNVSSGSFISFKVFLEESLLLILFFIIGLVYSIKNQKYNYLFIWLILNFFIISFNFFFYNRMLIFLNIVFIIYSGLGLSIIFEFLNCYQKYIYILLLFLIGSFSLFTISFNSTPLISKAEFNSINWIKENTPINAKIFYNNKYYLPWLIGWSNRTVIGHSIFGNEKYDEKLWVEHFKGGLSIIKKEKGIKYYYLGRFGKINYYNNKFKNNPCLIQVYYNNESSIFKYNSYCDYFETD